MADDLSEAFAGKIQTVAAKALSNVSWEEFAGPISEAAFEYLNEEIRKSHWKGLMLWDNAAGLAVQAFVSLNDNETLDGPTVPLIDLIKRDHGIGGVANMKASVEEFYKQAMAFLDEVESRK